MTHTQEALTMTMILKMNAILFILNLVNGVALKLNPNQARFEE